MIRRNRAKKAVNEKSAAVAKAVNEKAKKFKEEKKVVPPQKPVVETKEVVPTSPVVSAPLPNTTEKTIVKQVPNDGSKVERVPNDRSEYYGIGLIGANPVISKFKGILKMENKQVGKVLLEFMVKYVNDHEKGGK